MSISTIGKCGAISLIIIILSAIVILFIIYYLLKEYKKKARKAYAVSIVKYCNNLPDIEYSKIGKLVWPKNRNAYDYELAKYLLASSLLVTQSNCRNIVPIPNPYQFNNQERIVIEYPSDGKKRMFATVFGNDNPRRIMIVFTGTFYLDEWISDFDFPLKEAKDLNNYKPGIKVHSGFYDIYMTIKQDLWDVINRWMTYDTEFYITGHSLGAALACIAAFDFANLKPLHYSFASPRVGNVKFATTFNELIPNAFRIYNIEDVITEVPPPVIFNDIYKHVNNGIPFDVNLGTVASNHISSYILYLPRCIENIAPCNKIDNIPPTGFTIDTGRVDQK